MNVNLGGVVDLSTIDWRGRSTTVIFLRGCPLRCPYCHNKKILEGESIITTEYILEKIKDMKFVISGVVFSGGEPCLQGEALVELCQGVKDLGLGVCIHTSGIFPDVISTAIDRGVVDKVAIDYKIRLPEEIKQSYEVMVSKTIGICYESICNRSLKEMEVVFTIFKGDEDKVIGKCHEIDPDIPVILNQGISDELEMVAYGDLEAIADIIDNPVSIRTKEKGEVVIL